MSNAYEIIELPAGRYRLERISASAAWKNQVIAHNLNANAQLAMVDNRDSAQAVFDLPETTTVRLSHKVKDTRDGNLEQVATANDRSELVFWCEDASDGDFNDIKARLRRYSDPDCTSQIPVFEASAGSGAGPLVASVQLEADGGELVIPVGYGFTPPPIGTKQSRYHETVEELCLGDFPALIQPLREALGVPSLTVATLDERLVDLRLSVTRHSERAACFANRSDFSGGCTARVTSRAQNTDDTENGITWAIKISTVDAGGALIEDVEGWKLIRAEAILR